MCDKCESELEKKFHQAWLSNTTKKPQLTPQYVIEKHRVDFAIVQYNIAIEMDSKQYHSSPEAQKNDKERDDVLRSKGWKLIHLYGPDVHWHPNSSVEITLFMIANMFDQYVPARKLIPNGDDLIIPGKQTGIAIGLAVSNIIASLALLVGLLESFLPNPVVTVVDTRWTYIILIVCLSSPFWTKWIERYGKRIRGEKE